MAWTRTRPCICATSAEVRRHRRTESQALQTFEQACQSGLELHNLQLHTAAASALQLQLR
jgi:hypothetical protein